MIEWLKRRRVLDDMTTPVKEMNDKPPLTATVALVEFEQGPGLRIDIVIGWDRLRGLAQQIRWWSRMPASEKPAADD